jgi:hypothetical protein
MLIGLIVEFHIMKFKQPAMKTTCTQQMKFRGPCFSLLFLISINVMAQPGLNLYADFGSNNVSHGLFIKSAALGFYKFGKNNLETGFQADLKNYGIHGFSGYTLNASRDFTIKDMLIEIHGFYITTISSPIIRESNLGGLVKIKFNHFEMALGTNLRTFSFRQSVLTNYVIEKKSSKIHEASNLMYSFSYNLKPTESRWNAGMTVTNFDHFTIYQETNPMINLHGSYKINAPVSLYAQAWYKIAGASNLEVNYFGFYIKTGMIWNF